MRKGVVSYLFKQAARTVLHGWSQFLSIVAIGGIAVTLFVGLQANAESLENRVETMYADGNLADVFLTTNPLQYDKEDVNIVKERLNEGDVVESRFYAYASMNGHNTMTGIMPKYPNVSKASEILELAEGVDETHFFFVDEVLTTGQGEAQSETSTLALGKKATVTIDLSAYGLDYDFSFLDSYVKEGKTNVLSSGKIEMDFVVDGIMRHPENITRASYSTSLFLCSSLYFRDSLKDYLSSSYTDLGVRYLWTIFQMVLQWGDGAVDGDVTNFPAPNQYLIKLSDKSRTDACVYTLKETFENKLEKNLIAISGRDDMSFAMTMTSDVSQARQLTYVFPFVFFAVAILVILTTMSQLIIKERIQIGTMKAIGLTNKEIYGHYMGLTMGVVAIGTIIGEIIGPLIIPGIVGQKYGILYSLPPMGYVFPWLPAILTAVAFLFVSALVTFLVVRKHVVKQPAECMRSEPPSMTIKVSKEAKKARKPWLLSIRMAFRNIIMGPVKSIMVFIGVMGCTALLVCGYGIEDTIHHGIDTDPYMQSGASVTLTLAGEVSKDKLKEDFATLEDPSMIAGFECYSRNTIDLYNGNKNYTSFLQIIGGNLEEGQKSHFSYEFDEDKVLVSKKVADRLQVGAGDKISFSYNGYKVEGEIQYVFDAFYDNGLVIKCDSPLFETPVKKFGGVWVDGKEGADIEALKKATGSLSYVAAANSTQDWINTINDIMGSVMIMTNAIKVFAILLAVVVLYNLSLLNFRERTRDIATMKVLGFKRTEIAASLLWETMSLTAVGVGGGLAVGFPFMYLVLFINQIELVDYIYTVFPLSYLISFVLTFVVAFLVNLWLATRTNKVKMVESLKSVE